MPPARPQPRTECQNFDSVLAIGEPHAAARISASDRSPDFVKRPIPFWVADYEAKKFPPFPRLGIVRNRSSWLASERPTSSGTPAPKLVVMSTEISPASAKSAPAVQRRPRAAVRWLSRQADRRLLPALAAFFAENVSTCYISQTELWSGRAPDFAHWSPNLKRLIKAELRDTLVRDRARRIAVVERAGELVGLAVVVDLGRHYALLEDIVVQRESRGSGVGGTLVRWIFRQLREAGKTSVFLESGGRNTAAHRFFRRQGFRRVSIAMCRRLAA